MAAGYSFLAPEVIQTSAMDCGVAALKSMLLAHGLECSYERLREACQTAIDGTSIDTIEDVCVELGIDVSQHLVPEDLFYEACAMRLPAIVVTEGPAGSPHYIVLWRIVGDWVQTMNPASGRAWIRKSVFLNQLYEHTQRFETSEFNEWFPTSSFAEALTSSVRRILGNRAERPLEMIADWKDCAAVDVAVRLADKALGAGATGGSGERATFESLVSYARADLERAEKLIPDHIWAVRSRGDVVALRSVVFLGSTHPGLPTPVTQLEGSDSRVGRAIQSTLDRKLSAFHEFVEFLVRQRRKTALLGVGAVFLSLGSLAEFFLFRAALSLPPGFFDGRTQRLLLPLGLLSYFTVLLLLEGSLIRAVAALGRRFETELRMDISLKVARLGERYVESRSAADLAQRAHNIWSVRRLPEVIFGVMRGCLDLCLTTVAICVLDLRTGLLALAGVALTLATLTLTNAAITEIDLRFQTQAGGLFSVSLDALLGVIPVRTHGLDGALRQEQDALLVDWLGTGRQRLGWSSFSTAISSLLTSGLAVTLVLTFVGHQLDQRALVLLLLWVLRLPSQTQLLARATVQYPQIRNALLRIVEPLRIEEVAVPATPAVVRPAVPRQEFSVVQRGVRVELQHVTVLAGAHAVLHDVDLRFEPGEHVAIVGRSGAGKSSLLALLLGLYTPYAGTVLVDGAPLTREALDVLRQFTAWIDPTIQIWNRSMLYNIRCGTHQEVTRALSRVLADSNLLEVVEHLDAGLATMVGSGGAILSGGEGQRVRVARALFRAQSRLVILDEPFRGLDRDTRSRLLARTRELSSAATLFCATHDVRETAKFPRVLVVDEGRIVEDGAPRTLFERGGLYRSLIQADIALDQKIWGRNWDRLKLDHGSLIKSHDAVA